MTDTAALESFRALVDSHINTAKGEEFIPSRYPYTYAADFLLAHPEMVPEHIRADLIVIDSRSDASSALMMWADEAGVDAADAAAVLANAYLKENHVERVLAP